MRAQNALKILLLAFFFSYFFTPLYAQDANAEPIPPVIYLNRDTGECTYYYAGDECLDCTFSPALDNNWTRASDLTTCPLSYKEVKLPHECVMKKTPMCCTANEEGVEGDCDDLVIKGAERKCAFVEDITQCDTLPDGWEKPDSQSDWGVVCPSDDYEWVEDNLNCDGRVVDLDDDISVNVLYLEEDSENRTVFVLAAAFVLMGFLLWWFYFRKRKDK